MKPMMTSHYMTVNAKIHCIFVRCEEHDGRTDRQTDSTELHYCHTSRGARHCSGYCKTRRNPAHHRLDHSSIRASRSTPPALTWEPLSSGPEIYRALCAKIHAVCKTGWLVPDCHRIPNTCFALNTTLVLARLEADLALEAGLASTRS